jgi:hypothetical protein
MRKDIPVVYNSISFFWFKESSIGDGEVWIKHDRKGRPFTDIFF